MKRVAEKYEDAPLADRAAALEQRAQEANSHGVPVLPAVN